MIVGQHRAVSGWLDALPQRLQLELDWLTALPTPERVTARWRAVIVAESSVGEWTPDALSAMRRALPEPALVAVLQEACSESERALIEAGCDDCLAVADADVATVARVVERAMARRAAWRRQSDDQLRLAALAVEAVPTGVVILAADGPDPRVVYCNSGYERLSGYRAAEVLGTVHEGLHGPATAPEAAAELKQALRCCAGARLTLQQYRKDGRAFWADVSLSPITDESGQTTHCVVTYRDVSGRVRSRDALAQRVQELTLLHRISETVLQAPTLAEGFGSAVEAIREATGFEIVAIGRHLPDRGIIRFAGSTLQKPGEPPLEVDVDASLSGEVVKRGAPLVRVGERTPYRYRDTRLSADLLTFAGLPLMVKGRTIGVLSLASRRALEVEERWLPLLQTVAFYAASLLERSVAQEAVGDSEARLRTILSSIRDIVTVIDDEGRTTFISPSIETNLGYTEEAFDALGWAAIVHADDLEEGRRALARWRDGDTAPVDLRVRHADGQWRTLEAVGHPAPDDSPLAGLVVSARDITRQRELEAEYLHAQRMEALGRLAGGMAHDFNNLLAAILGYCELLLDQLGDAPGLREEVLGIRAATERGATLTGQLLAFSRRQIRRPRTFDLNELLRSLERMLARLIGEDIRLVTELDPSIDPVEADPAQVEQMVMNLVVNARDAMPSGGTLTLRTRTTAAAGEPRATVRLEVDDTGEGMPPEQLARIFEPFYTTKGPDKGTGLGLSLVYGVVRQNNGTIHVDSEPGRGTRFAVDLPVAAQAGREPGAAAAAATLSAEQGGATILLVEDAPPVRNLVRRMLERAGYRVVEAEHGEAGLAAAETLEGPLDLLLTDVVMPGMSGRQLAEKLQALRPGLPVLYMSGYADDTVLRHGIETAAETLLEKPFTAAELLARVRERVGR